MTEQRPTPPWREDSEPPEPPRPPVEPRMHPTSVATLFVLALGLSIVAFQVLVGAAGRRWKKNVRWPRHSACIELGEHPVRLDFRWLRVPRV